MADPGCGTGSTRSLCLNLLRALVGVSGRPREAEQLCRGCSDQSASPGAVICIQMLRKSCQSRPEGEGDLGRGKRGEARQCVPPKPPSSLGRWAQQAWGVGCSPSAAPSCPGCLSFLPFLPLLLLLLFPSPSACSPLSSCCCFVLKIPGNASERCLDPAHRLSDCSANPRANPT